VFHFFLPNLRRYDFLFNVRCVIGYLFEGDKENNSDCVPLYAGFAYVFTYSKLKLIEQLGRRILLDSSRDFQYHVWQICDFWLKDGAMLGFAALNPTY
jgi:hypothetical protein